jgi:alpha-D-ribose 1-methylphosphonate 5-triphosphate synthase subunit PhnG
MTPDEPDAAETARRQALMRVCAYATESELEGALAGFAGAANAEDLRAPEEGLVMLRGRIGGDGQRFNVGEATVTRAAVRLDDGTLGYAYLLGRCPRKARLAAIVDALGQREDTRDMLETVLVAPVTARREAAARERREETAATRVNFFTLVRGEDQP